MLLCVCDSELVCVCVTVSLCVCFPVGVRSFDKERKCYEFVVGLPSIQKTCLVDIDEMLVCNR